jgi:hypothetical protein
MVDKSVSIHGPCLPHLLSSARGACVGGRADQGVARGRPTTSAEVRLMPWSDRRYAGVCQRTLSCVISTAPMEAPTRDIVGGVCRCEPLIFIIFSNLSPADAME